MSFDLAELAVLLGLPMYTMAIARITVVLERIRAHKHAVPHRCPEPVVKVFEVERNHNPWGPTPWKRVDHLVETSPAAVPAGSV